MTTEILLALVASLFTATSSVAQRVAAAPAPGELSFNWRLLTFLIRRPVWFFGILCMIGGFGFQLAALHVGDLSLVQPVIATELLFVFGYLAVRNRNRVHGRDWLAAVAMAGGLGAFLAIASPRGDGGGANGWTWMISAGSTFAAAALFAGLAFVPFGKRRQPTPSRKAALLAISAGIAWGFVAAVIKELSSHLSGGYYAVFTNWSPYVLLLSGAIAMFILSNAFQAGSLAASQPGLTIVDPLVASLLGVTIFGEHIRHSPHDLLGELVSLMVLVAGVVLLSRSPLIRDEVAEVEVGPPGTGAPGPGPPSGGVGRDVPSAGSSAERRTTGAAPDDPTAIHRSPGETTARFEQGGPTPRARTEGVRASGPRAGQPTAGQPAAGQPAAGQGDGPRGTAPNPSDRADSAR